MSLPVALKDISILVVDDDQIILAQVEALLNQLEITQVTPIADGHAAIHLLDTGQRFDIIFLDLNMPGMDGVEFMRKLAARGYRRAIALISGEDIRILKTAQSLASAHHLKMIGCLHKPVTFDSLNLLLKDFDLAEDIVSGKPVTLVGAEELIAAINQQQIKPYFQPKVSAAAGRIESAEVLARWQKNGGEIILPISFIPVAEEHGLIHLLTMMLFEKAMYYYGRWLKQGFSFTLGFNLSTVSLDQVELPEALGKICQSYGVPCNKVDLEITESRLMQNLTTSLDVLTRLRLKGFGLSIDDFGTGYSSMAQLNQIPFTELKIDRAFVHGVSKDAAALAILESSAALAKKLDLTIVAEGAEDLDDWNSVSRVGCDLIQGYYIAKPMPADEFELWVMRNLTDCRTQRNDL